MQERLPDIQIYSRATKPKFKTKINVTSTSKSPFKIFSPFLLGPVQVEPYPGEIFECKNVENAWQFSKIYPGYEKKEKYLEWAKAGFASEKAQRFPMGRGAKCLYSLHKGEKLGYIDARKKIYCPLYEYAVLKYANKEFEDLKALANEGISLYDFDGYDNEAKGLTLKDVLNNPQRKMGHAFVLKMMILNERHYAEKAFC